MEGSKGQTSDHIFAQESLLSRSPAVCSFCCPPSTVWNVTSSRINRFLIACLSWGDNSVSQVLAEDLSSISRTHIGRAAGHSGMCMVIPMLRGGARQIHPCGWLASQPGLLGYLQASERLSFPPLKTGGHSPERWHLSLCSDLYI